MMERLNGELDKIKGKTVKGFIEAAIIIRRESENTPPITPLDTGNLRASWFTVHTRGDGRTSASPPGDVKDMSNHTTVVDSARSVLASHKEPALAFGYTANYAGYVHENMEAKFQRPGSGPKFLQQAIQSTRSKILKVVADNAKV